MTEKSRTGLNLDALFIGDKSENADIFKKTMDKLIDEHMGCLKISLLLRKTIRGAKLLRKLVNICKAFLMIYRFVFVLTQFLGIHHATLVI